MGGIEGVVGRRMPSKGIVNCLNAFLSDFSCDQALKKSFAKTFFPDQNRSKIGLNIFLGDASINSPQMA